MLLAVTDLRGDLAKDASAIRRKRLLDMNLGTVPKNWDRRTSIVATLGPATSTPQKIRDLIASGVDVMRLNFAHGEASEHAQRYEAVRAGEREVGRTVAVLQDLAGHKIRVGRLRDGALELRDGQSLIITADEVDGGDRTISTNYPGLPRNVHKGDRILLDDGTLELVVESTTATAVTTRCVRGGILKEHKGVNLPGVSVDLPAMTAKDLKDLEFGIRLGVDYVALSFVQQATDVALARQAIAERGATIPIIAKLEKAEAINALDEIIKEADGVMVARGDLGVELDAEWVPVLQNTIIQKAVKMMDRIARVIESSTPTIFGARGPAQEGTTISLAHAAATIAHDISARAIVVMTRSGLTAQLLSKLRPHAPLIAFTEQETTAHRLALWWGVQCFATTFEDNTDAMIAHLEDELLRRRLAEIGDTVIIVGSAPLVVRGRVNFVKMHRVRHTDA